MADSKQDLQERADALHAEEERKKALAANMDDGPERDALYMAGERLSDEAWSLEEAHDLEPTPSGIWPASKPA